MHPITIVQHFTIKFRETSTRVKYIITANQIVGKYHKKPIRIQSSPRKLLKVHENARDQFGFILASDWLKGQRKFP